MFENDNVRCEIFFYYYFSICFLQSVSSVDIINNRFPLGLDDTHKCKWMAVIKTVDLFIDNVIGLWQRKSDTFLFVRVFWVTNCCCCFQVDFFFSYDFFWKMNFVQKWIKHANIIFSYFYSSRLNFCSHCKETFLGANCTCNGCDYEFKLDLTASMTSASVQESS